MYNVANYINLIPAFLQSLIERDAGAMFDALLVYCDALLKNGISLEKYIPD